MKLTESKLREMIEGMLREYDDWDDAYYDTASGRSDADFSGHMGELIQDTVKAFLDYYSGESSFYDAEEAYDELLNQAGYSTVPGLQLSRGEAEDYQDRIIDELEYQMRQSTESKLKEVVAGTIKEMSQEKMVKVKKELVKMSDSLTTLEFAFSGENRKRIEVARKNIEEIVTGVD